MFAPFVVEELVVGIKVRELSFNGLRHALTATTGWIAVGVLRPKPVQDESIFLAQ